MAEQRNFHDKVKKSSKKMFKKGRNKDRDLKHSQVDFSYVQAPVVSKKVNKTGVSATEKATPRATVVPTTKKSKPKSSSSTRRGGGRGGGRGGMKRRTPRKPNYQTPTAANEPNTFTENLSPSFSTSGDARLDLFFSGLLRGCPREKLYALLRKSWLDNPVHTIALILHARNCRGGKGEREVVMESFIWLRRWAPKTYKLNLRELINVGCHRDLLAIAAKVFQIRSGNIDDNINMEHERYELELMAEDIKSDEKSLSDEKDDDNNNKKKKVVKISLAAKWAPNEKHFFDKPAQGRLGKLLREILFPNQDDAARSYRKLLAKLRAHVKVVEQLMCAGKWEKINFGAVPSRAHNIYRAAFQKHEEERYNKYIQDVKTGKSKINTTGLFPHQIVKPYLGRSAGTMDDTLEVQWTDLIDKLKQDGTVEDALAVVDVSGSMTGTPMEVAISLGLVLSLLTSSPCWHRQLITFTADPQWHEVKGESLHEMVENVRSMKWGMSTAFNKVFEMILRRAQAEGSSADDIPSTVFVFSDMQFDSADRSAKKTNYQIIQERYAKAGYKMPQMVFWNLQGKTVDFPATKDDHGVSLISGFSSDLMKLFLNGGELSSLQVLMEAIEKYIPKVKIDDSEL